ncbi:hypothetical protein [Xylophilus sp. GOD-11R]|uniref:hypothetical protein n=1 Tax=Xylophilus sp. GOD-11R TaxID=3089814 RepID=UPI00298D06D5|nr:hypothetical protein [Xylophilus sp. GOD-11R]WPB56653.1 hypothetical protein R9X41_21330 [Xylophilus sp. GOD-11R]
MADQTLVSLARDAATEIAQLRDLLGAYVGLETLIEPHPDADDLLVDRRQLGALLRLMNGGVHRQLELTESLVGSMLGRTQTLPSQVLRPAS